MFVFFSGEEFEDLEEILSRFIQPMAANCREVSGGGDYGSMWGQIVI